MGSTQVKPAQAASYHQVQILSTLHGNSREIIGYCDDEFSLNFGNNWSAPFSGIEALAGKVGAVMSATSNTITSQAMTALTWKNSTPPDISIGLEFFAQDNENIDVLQPLADIIGITVPKLSSESGFVLELPGPSSAQYALNALRKLTQRGGVQDGDENQTTNYISLRIGNVLTMPSVVVKRLDLKLRTRVSTRRNLPVSFAADMVFQPFVCPYLDDINAMLGLPSLQPGQ